MTNSTPGAWKAALADLHLRELPQSSYVPVDAWLVDLLVPGRLLRLQARGTKVRLSAYDAADLTTMLVRAECDCEQHRQAGAAGRPALRPGAVPTAEAVYDGAVEAGWRGVEAGLLRADDVATHLVALHHVLAQDVVLEAAG